MGKIFCFPQQHNDHTEIKFSQHLPNHVGTIREFKMKKIILTILLCMSPTACQTNALKITSKPEKATIEILNPDTETYSIVGTTPFESTNKKTMLPISLLSSELVSIRISKPGFISEQILLEKKGRPKIKLHANLQEIMSSEATIEKNNKAGKLVDNIATTVAKIQRYAAENNLKKASELTDELLKDHQTSYVLWNTKGSILLTQGKKSEAIEAYKKSLILKPDNIETRQALKELGVK